LSRPIPLNLLIHTISHSAVTGVDKYGNETVTTATVNHVRLEPSQQTALDSYGEAKDDKYLLFWDRVNSGSATFAKGDKVTFSGVVLTIREIFMAYDEKSLHHLEIYLT